MSPELIIAIVVCFLALFLVVRVFDPACFLKCRKCGSRKTLTWHRESPDASFPDSIHYMRILRCFSCGVSNQCISHSIYPPRPDGVGD